MSSSWATALFAAAAVALVTTPLFRQLARSIGLFDEPAPCKVKTVPVPYLGGLAIAVGTLIGILVAPGGGFEVGAVMFIAAALCALGLLDDDHHLLARTRLAVEVIAALATLALGLRFQVTGIGLVDGGLTVVWIVGLTNATNFLDNMDGLGAGVAASITGSSLFLALGNGGQSVAVLAAAVVGACLGFLAYNKRPASVHMGDAGSLFLGYLLSVVTLAATQSLPPGPRFVAPLMLAAVPVADTATVVVARLRRGIHPTQAGKDHLSHRLVRRGLPAGSAVAVLVTASLLVGFLGAFAGRGVLPLSAALGVAVIVLGLLVRAALPARVYDTPAVGLPGWARLVGVGTIAGAVLAWQTGLFTLGGSGSTTPLLQAGNGMSSPVLALLGAGFAVLNTVLLVVCHRRQATWRGLSDHSFRPTGRRHPDLVGEDYK
jgi:UDP-GlcNAc:undecaprenyl-phosphate/decaprenyl-phosphate GlcNAc-1-phosphate transferase